MKLEFIGYKNGCTYCGKPLRKKWKMNPFYEPTVVACDRHYCSVKRYVKRKFDIVVKKKVKSVLFYIRDVFNSLGRSLE